MPVQVALLRKPRENEWNGKSFYRRSTNVRDFDVVTLVTGVANQHHQCTVAESQHHQCTVAESQCSKQLDDAHVTRHQLANQSIINLSIHSHLNHFLCFY